MSFEFDPEIVASQIYREDFGLQIGNYPISLSVDPNDDTVVSRYEGLEQLERLFSPTLCSGGYHDGSALHADETVVYAGQKPNLIVSAEHATHHVRAGGHKEADWGTGAIAHALHVIDGFSFVAPIGRQTGDANFDSRHQVKEVVSGLASALPSSPATFFSVHGMNAGNHHNPYEQSGYDVILGVGSKPSDRTKELADQIKALGREQFGLNVEVNAKFLKMTGKYPEYRPEIDENGQLKLTSYAARRPCTTRAHFQGVAETLELEHAAMQIELSQLLRICPRDVDRRDAASRVLGSCLGLIFMLDACRLAARINI